MSNSYWESMTGFAVCEAALEGTTFRAQLKSVNHKHFELKLRAPREFGPVEHLWRNRLRELLKRGSADLQIDRVMKGQGSEEVDPSFWKSVRANYERACDAFKPTADEKASLLAQVINQCSQLKEGASELNQEALESFVETVCQKLSTSLLVLRRTEGAGIRDAMLGEYQTLKDSLAKFDEALPGIQENWKKDLEKRIVEWSEKLKVATPDQNRIHQELVMILEKRDVAEELQRIRSHLIALDALLNPKVQVESLGKRLDFVAQELHREWTTLNNKVAEPSLGHAVANAKLAIDRIREQGLNVV